MAGSRWLIALSVLLLGLVGLLLVELHRRPAEPPIAPAAVVVAPAPPAPAPAGHALPPPVAAARVQIRAGVRELIRQEVPPLKSQRNVEDYLTELENRARRQGRVTVLELEPGRAAIKNLRASIGEENALQMETAFSDRMMKLSAELGHRPAPPDGNDREKTLERLVHSNEGSAK